MKQSGALLLSVVGPAVAFMAPPAAHLPQLGATAAGRTQHTPSTQALWGSTNAGINRHKCRRASVSAARPLFMLPPEVFVSESGFLASLMPLAEEAITYSRASYYTTLFLYVLSFPGLISLITRSVKTKNVRRTFLTEGPEASKPKPLRQVAGEVMAYFTANNYQVADNSGSSVTFKGVVGKSKSQAFFLVFCTFLGLVSLALVLSIQFQDIGQNWYYITLLSPYAGVYYWQKASREDTVTVRIEVPDDGKKAEIAVEGGKEELERMAETLKYEEKGMVRVKGIFERE